MRELREMKIELNKETTCKENAVAEAMKVRNITKTCPCNKQTFFSCK